MSQSVVMTMSVCVRAHFCLRCTTTVSRCSWWRSWCAEESCWIGSSNRRSFRRERPALCFTPSLRLSSTCTHRGWGWLEILKHSIQPFGVYCVYNLCFYITSNKTDEHRKPSFVCVKHRIIKTVVYNDLLGARTSCMKISFEPIFTF